MSNPYTVHDTPSIVATIERDLDLVVAELRKSDPAMVSLVLTGGFARGEGAVLNGKPQNDYDFVVFRKLGRSRRPYPDIRKFLEHRIGLHIDLAPVSTLRLPFLRNSIFWYETALRGRVLWGNQYLQRIRTRSPNDLDPAEGLRLLVNRAAGLLLAMDTPDTHLRRIQASKAFLAAADVHLLSRGLFAPSQRERFDQLQRLIRSDAPPTPLDAAWTEWAYRFKTDPANAPTHPADEAWRAGAKAILASVPTALHHAGLSSLDEYARHDRLIDHLVYYRRAARIPGARFTTNPTGRVRVGTLRLLEAALEGPLTREQARRWFAQLVRRFDEPIRTLDVLRTATLQ